MRRFKAFTSIIIVVFCISVLSSCKYIFKPYNEINEEIPDNLNSSISIAEYALNIVEEDCGKEFEIGSVDMHLDSELKGEVSIGLVESNKKKPYAVFVNFDTKNNRLFNIDYYEREGQVNPGIINLQNWKIDYAEAIEISKEFYSKTQGFRYDSVWIQTIDSFPAKDEDWEDWSVILNDEQSGKRYYTRINPYTGEILIHSIWEY